jgi:hypothetical protein
MTGTLPESFRHGCWCCVAKDAPDGIAKSKPGDAFPNPCCGKRGTLVLGSSWMASMLLESCINKRSRVRRLFTVNNCFAAKKDADNFRCAVRQQPCMHELGAQGFVSSPACPGNNCWIYPWYPSVHTCIRFQSMRSIWMHQIGPRLRDLPRQSQDGWRSQMVNTPKAG